MIDAGQPSDLDLIIPLTYPWDLSHPGHSLEGHDDATSISNNPNSSGPLTRSPYVSFVFEGQLTQDVDRHGSGTESYRTLLEQQSSSHTGLSTVRVVSQPPDSGYQTASEEFPGNNDDTSLLFDMDWWNTMPTDNIWNCPPLV